MRIITFTDGTTMSYEQYRSECLIATAALSINGEHHFKVGRCMAFAWALISIEEALLSIRVFFDGRFALYVLLIISSVMLLAFSKWAMRIAKRGQQTLLQRRQSIMDSLDRITKSFQE